MQRKFFAWLSNDFQQFTESPEIAITKVEAWQDGTVVYFETREDKTHKEMTKLERTKAFAEKVMSDETYAKLKNARQRELHLLEKYTINSHDAGDVIEYIAMQKVGGL